MNAQMMRVISSPSSSTTGFFTLIWLMVSVSQEGLSEGRVVASPADPPHTGDEHVTDKQPVKVAVTGPDQPVELRLLEITPALRAVEGVIMELDDCAFPLLANVEYSDDPNVIFDGGEGQVRRSAGRPAGVGGAQSG